jgi:glutamate-ammonia-ligase adenylyltransferase
MLTSLPHPLVAEAEIKWQDFTDAAKTAGVVIPDNDPLVGQLKAAFAYSNFISRSLTASPEILTDLINSGDLFTANAEGHLHQRAEAAAQTVIDETGLGETLKLFRKREALRIALRDLMGLASLDETMADMSHVAEICIDQAITFLHRRQAEKDGQPKDEAGNSQQLTIIGLGKLGAGELNFSSDIDLLFAYPEQGMTAGGSNTISNDEFFSRVCREFLKLFGASAASGMLFRVDLRLRPFGENGPLTMSFGAMESYYQSQGRDWERYALIKARPVGGDLQAGRELIQRLKPFVYRRYFDYGSFDALRKMKQSISAEVARQKVKNNIKIGQGGIREIEFFGQVFQLIRGGVDPELQQRQILTIIDLLMKRNYITRDICDELTAAYRFFRNTEHRLQMVDDRQTHTLPTDDLEQIRIAAASGFSTWKAFDNQVSHYRNSVHHHFDQLLAAEDAEETDVDDNPFDGVWLALVDPSEAESILKEAGYENGEEIRKLVDFLRNDVETRALSLEGRQRLNRLMPMILKRVARLDSATTILTRLIDLVKSIERRTCYISLLLENPGALDHLVRLAQASPWIIAFISRHPVLLDELLDTRTLYRPPTKTEMEEELLERLNRVPASDLEMQIEELCIFKQLTTLRVAAADISAAYPLMRVSDHLSDLAETVLGKVVDLSWQYLVDKHGPPRASIGGVPTGEKGFAVVAYGKLGGIELGYGSDLDLVFLHAGDPGQTRGEKTPTENIQFYSRLGQRIVHTLTVHTRAGTLYEIDMRLRPSGSSGPLVSHIDAFTNYQAENAWTWEHQAIVRARVIYGDPAVTERFIRIRQDILCRSRQRMTLGEEIRTMRERMRTTRLKTPAGCFDLKQSPGGIVDIEFLVQHLVLLYSSETPELTRWTDNVRILESLADCGIIAQAEARFLKEAYLFYRAAVHRLNLKQQPEQVPVETVENYYKKVKRIWKNTLAPQPPENNPNLQD